MRTFKKAYLLIKIGFLSIFGTTKGLRNIEKDWEYITDQDLKNAKATEKSKSPSQ